MLEYNEEMLRYDVKVNGGRPYQQCSLSLMDTISDPGISFDQNGICNYYFEYKEQERKLVYKGEEGLRMLESIVNEIKDAGKGKKYDCITGVSGGVDSTYLVYLAKKYGLRVLVVHFDNGWNSEIAVKNIENIIGKLGFDLYTLVVNWEEFKDLQLSYFKASVVDIEAITDHAIIATMYKLALKNDIKFILSGTNTVTEATLPKYWIYNKVDHRNIQAIHKKFGVVPLRTYPFFDTRLKKMSQLKGIQTLSLLDYVDYNKAVVKEVISKELGWRDYGGKHFESIFTRFYQGYILPVKFSIDKRKAHLSNLIFSGQITKEDALAEIMKPIYPKLQLEEDKVFALKKLGYSEREFDEYLIAPRHEHSEFDMERPFFEEYPMLSPLKPVANFLRSFLQK